MGDAPTEKGPQYPLSRLRVVAEFFLFLVCGSLAGGVLGCTIEMAERCLERQYLVEQENLMNLVQMSAALCSCCFLAAPAMVFAQQPLAKAGRTLTIDSSATVHAKPDIARLSFFVVTEGVTKVREENDKQVKKTKDQLTALGLANVEIQIVPYALGTVPANEVVPNGVPQPHLQHAQTLFTVVVREKNLDKLRGAITRLADVATENGGKATGKTEDPLGGLPPAGFGKRARVANPVAGPRIEWIKENTSDSQREAVKRAVDEALANAQAAVGEAKLTVVEIHVARVSQRDEPYVPVLLRANADLQAGSSQVPITMKVTVVYSY
jgi:uncharacterized protein YggE